MLEKPLFEVMLSSTFRDLVEHRTYVSDVLKRHRLHAIEMEDDATLSDQDMIDASIAKVDAASAYVCIIGKRYGQIRQCDIRNPDSLSLTELEFERAISREIPITVLVMGADYPVPDKANEFDPAKRDKLQAFRDRVGMPHRVTADFDSWEQFLTSVPTAIAELRSALERRVASAARIVASEDSSPVLRSDDFLPPSPPAFHIVKPFAQGHPFVGRKKEIERITRWAMGPNPLLIFEAIGGMGKSMVTYHWIDQHAPTVRPDLAGRLWYSFYEEGASMNDFCVHALAYIERRAPRDFIGRRTRELEPLLVKHLNEQPWLIVMDGLERVLVAYNRFDKAQIRDDEAVADPDKTGRDPNRCIHPADDHLLLGMATARSSKLLVSTRNMPTVLLNASDNPIAGIERERLTGLEQEDAERMMREAGVTGQSAQMQSYLETHFECHPLMVGVVAGLVNTYVPTPGSFDRWLDDPQGAGAIDLTETRGLVAKRDHILKVAYEALEPDERRLLGVLAFFSQSVPGEVLVELNPRRPPRPQEVERPLRADVATDPDLAMLKTRLEGEQSAEAKAEIEHQIAARRKELDDLFERQAEMHRQYETALKQWRMSPELRASDAWLGKAAIDLQKRGLVITDRLTARYDLHPMVRGFVRHGQNDEESAVTGRAVADYTQSRSKRRYENAASLNDVAQGIQIVTALTLGGHYEDAAAMLDNSDLDAALRRLELVADFLELLRPLFLQGWNNLPELVSDKRKGDVSRAAAEVFMKLGDYQRADALFQLAITHEIASKDLRSAAYAMFSYSNLVGLKGSLALQAKLLNFVEINISHLESEPLAVTLSLVQIGNNLRRGEIASARKAIGPIKVAAAKLNSTSYENEGNILAIEIDLLEKEQLLTESSLDEAIARARSWGRRFRERELLARRGRFLESKGEHHQAIEAFEKALAMARESYIPDTETEASFATSLLAIGQRAEALEIAARLSAVAQPPHVRLAELYVALADKMGARQHALLGYYKAWAEGPPYAFHWDLEDCRKVLRTLGEPEPKLSPFDRAKVPPFEFEPELHRLIDQKKAELEAAKSNRKGKTADAAGKPDLPPA
jgi:tetratricopeptide (TPR) repeat protein